MKSVKYITLIFENCECFDIPRNAIGLFLIDEISKRIVRTACSDIASVDYADVFAMEFYSEGNESYCESDVTAGKRMFERISEWHDITSVEVHYDDDTFEIYCLAYDEDSTEQNIHQQVYISELGNLYLVIAEGKDIEDYFDIRKINDAKALSTQKGYVLSQGD